MGGESTSLIELGIVGAPFGVRGWVKLRSFTDPPERLLQHRSVLLSIGGSWITYAIEASGRSGGQLTAKLAGVNDRDQARALRGVGVGVPRSELPPRDAKDFYRADLIGCEVVNLAGTSLGTVRHFVETPAQVLMVVRGGTAASGAAVRGVEACAAAVRGVETCGGAAASAAAVRDLAAATGAGAASGATAARAEYWIPALPRHLRRVDLEARRVVVDWDDSA